ncbi:MAG: class III cytochrome C family protein [Bacteroidetes bacterium]|nr:class III cytochrome C family protein [Bacteroidota bacterium]
MKKIIFILITGLVVWAVIEYPKQMVNPGDLIAGHQKLSNDCYSCHRPFWGISNDKCITCHKISEIGKLKNSTDSNSKKDKSLFHENLTSQNCASCHTDHMGIKPDTKLSNFKHDLLSTDIKNNCSDCHTKPSDKLHIPLSSSCNNCHVTTGWKQSVKFNHDMISGADKNNCITCHQKPGDSFHQGLLDNCNKCHTTNKWSPANFNHSSYFLLDKDHNAKCNVCHTSSNYKEYTCYGCHEHTQSNILKEHDEVSGNINDCVSCHTSGNKHDMKDGNENNERDGKESKHESKKRENDDDDD